MCPVDVKPDGTSSSGGKTEVKISSRLSVTDTNYRTACALTRSPVFIIQSHGILYQTPRLALDNLHHLARYLLFIVRSQLAELDI
jgi:hypothetical protein